MSCGPRSELGDMVDLLLCYIHSTRTGDWLMRLQCLQEMLPWMASSDRTNYNRYLQVYILQMLTLRQTHPNVHAECLEGNFSVQRTADYAFNRIPHNQATKLKINRDRKTPGGLIGKTLRHGDCSRQNAIPPLWQGAKWRECTGRSNTQG